MRRAFIRRIIGCPVVLLRCVRSTEEGKKLLDSGKGIQTEYGLLFENSEIEFAEFYEGAAFPSYHCDPNAVAWVEIDCNGMTETVELPCEEMAIKKAICRLGADDLKSCKLTVFSDNVTEKNWLKILDQHEKTKDIFGLNHLLKFEKICDDRKPSKDIFYDEFKRTLRKNGFLITEEKDGATIYNDGLAAVKYYLNGTFGALKKCPDDVYNRIKGIAKSVDEYCTAYKNSPLLNAKTLSEHYRLLSEFNKTVFAAKYTEIGFMFATWDRTYDGEGVMQGNYYTDYLAAKENFAVRSGLVDKDKMFSADEFAQLAQCVGFTLENDVDLSFDENEALEKLSEKISGILPEPEQREASKMTM